MRAERSQAIARRALVYQAGRLQGRAAPVNAIFVSNFSRRRAAPNGGETLRNFRGMAVVLGALATLASGWPAEARKIVNFVSPYNPGTIVISQSERKLYLVTGPDSAIAYPVAVAKRGKEWSGYARVDGKYVNPAWSPPDSVKRDHPELPDVIPGGSPHNPMGVRAITLDRDEVAIHGTTARMRASVGTAASYGCIRMYNEDVIDLYDRVNVGAPVVMTP
jgi:lipoprotein-anchoring transpeptidase ErfK/SrfK